MSDEGDKAQLFQNNREYGLFCLWRNRNQELCYALENETEGLLEVVFYVQREVKSLCSGGRSLNEANIDDALDAIRKLRKLDDILNEIVKKQLDDGDEKKAEAILDFSFMLDNSEFKWGDRKVANYYLNQHSKRGADIDIPDDVAATIWNKIKQCIVPKLCLWHIAFMVHPCDALGAMEKRKQVMADLYDAIQSGCLTANTSPPMIPNMVDNGQTIDRWEVHINDFKKAVKDSSLKPYLNKYIDVWASYIPRRTKAFGRLENPEPFLSKKIEMTGNALDAEDFYNAFLTNLVSQKGERDHSKAFNDAMKQVVEADKIEGYSITDAIDDYEEGEQVPFDIEEQAVLDSSDDWKVDYLDMGVNSKHCDLIRDAYDRHRYKFKNQPTLTALWSSIGRLCGEEYGLKLDGNTYTNGYDFKLTKKTFGDIYKRGLSKLIKKRSS